MALACCFALSSRGALPASSLANPLATPVRVVVVANFENGADTGDKPGEYQFWVEREHLDETLKVRGAKGVVRRNKHGPCRTQWARDWVKLWTHGEGTFAMTNMESQTAARLMDSFSKLGFVDLKRVMVLRTASNPSGPPPGVDALASIGDEAPGQVAAYEANYRVGAPVVHELLKDWSRYRDVIPQAAFK
jgi:hypothetical protein